MASVYYDVQRRGGIARTYELLRDGHSSHELTAAVRSGQVLRARQGHYACPELDVDEFRALRVGGRLTGLAGARRHGIWAPVSIVIDIVVRADARSLRTPSDERVRLAAEPDSSVRVAWTDHGVSGTRSLVNPTECIRHILRHEPMIVAFAVCESAVNGGIVSRATVVGMHPLLKNVSPLSESGGESMLKFHLLRARIGFRQQVQIDGVGRVDFVIGERLVVEVDGAAFHSERAAFESDRRRDAELIARGYSVLRFSYRQVESRWPEVSRALRACLRRCDHLW